MNKQQLDTIVQAVVGIAALALLAWLVSRGDLEGTTIIPILTAILAALGFTEVGRRQGRKGA